MSRIFALHGFTGNERSFDALQLPHLTCGLLGGHGPTPCLDRPDFSGEVKHWLNVLRQQHSAPVHLLGYSLGARLGLAMLIAEPELFSRATLVGVNPGLEDGQARQQRLHWEEDWAQLLQREGLESFERAWSKQDLFSSQGALASVARDAQRKTRLSHTAPGLVHAMKNLGLGRMPNLWNDLNTIRVTTQLIVGQSDTKFLSIAKRMCHHNALFQMSEVPGAGHNPMLEFPDFFRDLLEAGRP